MDSTSEELLRLTDTQHHGQHAMPATAIVVQATLEQMQKTTLLVWYGAIPVLVLDAHLGIQRYQQQHSQTTAWLMENVIILRLIRNIAGAMEDQITIVGPLNNYVQTKLDGHYHTKNSSCKHT